MCYPPRIHEKLSLPEISWRNEEFAMKLFGIVWQKFSGGKKWFPFFSSKQFLRCQSFIETTRSSQWISRNYETKKVTEKHDTSFSPSLIHTIVSQPDLFWSTEEFSMNVFGNLRQNKFDGKAFCPPSQPKIVFAARVFPKPRRFRSESFR